MKLGIKIGLDNWHSNLVKTRASYCEVYFRFDKKEQYKEIFAYLRQHQILGGLHFWAILSNGYLANLATQDKKILTESVNLIKQTIDIASANKLIYVNVHPESFWDFKVDFDNGRVHSLSKKTTPPEGEKILSETAMELTEYGQQRGVNFFLETVPRLQPSQWWSSKTGRLKTIDTKSVSVQTLIRLSKKGVMIANDFCHTATWEKSSDRKIMWQSLWKWTKQLFPQTKLIHLNTIITPFNGTDSHHGLTDKDFAQKVFPNKKQWLTIFKLFKDRNDVIAIPEPYHHHVNNYKIIKEMMEPKR